MRKPEQRAWDALRRALQAWGCLALRVENMLDEGFPDVVVQHPAADVTFIELKARDLVPSESAMALGAQFGLRPSQRNWWLAYHAAGGCRGLLVARIGRVTYAHDSHAADAINGWSFVKFKRQAIAIGTDGVARLAATTFWSR